MKILLAPWGDPSGWKETTYIFGGIKTKSSSSLKILQEVIEPDETIIVASDTLALKGSTYEEIKQDAKSKTKNHAEEFGIKNFEIEIFPGVGHFQNKNTKKEAHFYGNAQDYYYSLIYKFVQKFSDLIPKVMEVHLDITHGVNYMPVLLYRGLRELLNTLALFSEVKLFVYNTDPAQPFNLLEETKVNIIEESKILPIPFWEKASNNELINISNLNNDQKKEIRKSLCSLMNGSITYNAVSAFIGSIYNGLPLGVYRFFPDAEKLNEYIKESYQLFEDNIEIIDDNNKLIVKRNVSLESNFKVFNFALLNLSFLKAHVTSNNITNEVSLSELNNLNKNFFKFNRRLNVTIDKEINDIRLKLKDKNVSKWTSLNMLINNKDHTEIDKRNFLAHAGFERNAVEVKKVRNEIYLRYRESLIKTIIQECQTGLL